MIRFVETSAGKTSFKPIVVIVIVLLFASFLLQNMAIVDINFLFWKITMSRVLLLLGSLVIGCLIGLLLGWEIFGKIDKGN